MNILIADDDFVSLQVLAEVLKDAGHNVIQASDGMQAWKLFCERPANIVITDWMMPGMSGIELCRKIRNESPAGYVYVVILTSRSGATNVVEGMDAGADEFLAKPIQPVELVARVRAGQRILALESRHVAIFGMAKLAESRDPETGQHLERVRAFSRSLALHMRKSEDFRDQLTLEFIDTVYLTSPLHDIGKVGIPDCVLLKPGRLDDAEFQIMKTHTQIGADTLSAAVAQYPEVDFLRIARDIALTHHERFDGAGYPRGLRGDDIPLCGRIVALADVYDALTSKRVYKSAYTHQMAVNIIAEQKGRQFDPRAVDAFIACQHEFLDFRSRFAEPGETGM